MSKLLNVEQALSLLSDDRRDKLVEAARLYRPCLHADAVRNLGGSSAGASEECKRYEGIFLEELRLSAEDLSPGGFSIAGTPAEICIFICRMGTSAS